MTLDSIRNSCDVFIQKESRLDSLLHRRARQGDFEGVRQVTWSARILVVFVALVVIVILAILVVLVLVILVVLVG